MPLISFEFDAANNANIAGSVMAIDRRGFKRYRCRRVRENSPPTGAAHPAFCGTGQTPGGTIHDPKQVFISHDLFDIVLATNY
jgi:hypothetical protein